jgi:hypothetical protein
MEATTVLDAAPETDVLSAGETTVLEQPACETTVLSQPAAETTVLDAYMPAAQPEIVPENANFFEIEYEITCIHTQEVI